MACAFGAVLGCGAPTHAAEADRISSDRPDFLSGPDAVGRGRIQIEGGALVERLDRDDQRTRQVSTPALLRLGVTESLELRVETEGRLRERETTLATSATTYTTGYADAAVGAKWQTHKGESSQGGPAIGWILQAKLPTGSRAVRGEGVRPSLIGAFAWELAGELEVTVNAGAKRESDEQGRRYTAAVLGVGFTKALTPRLSVGGEVVARQLASKRHGGNDVVADVLATYLVTRAVQLDALVGRGLTHDAPRYLLGTGVTARF